MYIDMFVWRYQVLNLIGKLDRKSSRCLGRDTVATVNSVLGVSRHSLRILDQLAANDLNAHELGGLPLPVEVLHSPKKDKLH